MAVITFHETIHYIFSALPCNFFILMRTCSHCFFPKRLNSMRSLENKEHYKKHWTGYLFHIVMDLFNALPVNSCVNTVWHEKIEEALFSVDPTDAPVDWLDIDHVICVYCRSIRSRQLRVTSE
jgi:hypothetical protein